MEDITIKYGDALKRVNTDNSKVNLNLLKENGELKERIRELEEIIKRPNQNT